MDLGRGELAGDASFSYLREESLIQKNRNKMKSDQEGEISVFGAERYFNLRIEDDNISNDPKIVDLRSSSPSTKKENNLDHDLGNERPRLAPGTPSACSEVSWNSRSTAMLLRNPSRHHNGSHNNKNKKKKMMKKINSYGRSILATLGCTGSCLDEKAVYVVDDDHHHHPGKLVLENIREPKSADHDHVHHGHHLELERSSKRSEEQFAFPILSSTNTTTTTIAKDYNKRVDQQEVEEEDGRVSLEVFGSKTRTKGNDIHDDVAANLERKLSVLTWDAIPVKPGHNIINKQISSMYNDQDNNTLDSDASSDLFEIENITASSRSPEQPPPPPPPPPQQQQHPASVLLLKASRQLLVSNDNISRHTTLNYYNNNAASSQYYSSYEPSEASIEWSVVTASAAADHMSSALSDYNQKKLAAAANSRMTAGGGSVSCYNNKVMARSRSSSFKAGRLDNEEVRSRGGHSHGFLGCKSHKAVRVAETAQRNVSSHKDQIIKANQTVDIIRPQ